MKTPLVMECAQCRAFFESRRQDAKTCSPKCRQAWARGLRRARQDAEKEYANRRPDLGTQLTIPDLGDAQAEQLPAAQVEQLPAAQVEQLPAAQVEQLPAAQVAPRPAQVAPRPARPAGAGNGPESLSGALSEAIRRITQAGPGDAT